jgi:tetratricopeptide (TPR) repeat protein
MMATSRDALWMIIGCAVAIVLAPASGRGETLQRGLDALTADSDSMSLPKLEEALRILREQATAADRDGAIHDHLARAFEALAIYYTTRGDPARAVGYLEQAVANARVAVERNPRSSTFQATIGNLYGELAARSGVVGRVRYGRLANAAYAHALALDPRDARAHLGIGIGKLETPAMFGGSITEALREFRRARELDPGCDEAWVWEGIALRRQGAVAAARRAFTHALAVNPHSDHARQELTALEEDF